jgi:hypothetical protein
MFDTEFGELVLTHKELQAYMDRKYPYMEYKIKFFEGTVRIPVIVSKVEEDVKPKTRVSNKRK